MIVAKKVMRFMKILLTGASGVMGLATLKALAERKIPVRAFCLPTKKDQLAVKAAYPSAELFCGDLRSYRDVKSSLDGIELVLHCGAVIPPLADSNPALCMAVNVGGTKYILKAIEELNMLHTCKLVYISSVAVYGDRLPPIHWARVGDPIKNSYFDYYGYSKILCERMIIESPLQDWVILRQTGVLSPSMIGHRSPLIFHQPLNNVLEYLSDRDSGRLLAQIAENPNKPIWGNIYNLGGGEALRLPYVQLLAHAFGNLGLPNLHKIVDESYFVERNFHGVYYLDSDRLAEHYPYVEDGIEYLDECSHRHFRGWDKHLQKLLKCPPLRHIVEKIIRRKLRALSQAKDGPLGILQAQNPAKIQAFFAGMESPIPNPNDCQADINFAKQSPLEHGWNESNSVASLQITDLQAAAKFRGGECLSSTMEQGNWRKTLDFRCAFGHEFSASPNLILKAGHFCPHCEDASWKPQAMAKHNPFFAQVWYPLHNKNEEECEVKKYNFLQREETNE